MNKKHVIFGIIVCILLNCNTMVTSSEGEVPSAPSATQSGPNSQPAPVTPKQSSPVIPNQPAPVTPNQPAPVIPKQKKIEHKTPQEQQNNENPQIKRQEPNYSQQFSIKAATQDPSQNIAPDQAENDDINKKNDSETKKNAIKDNTTYKTTYPQPYNWTNAPEDLPKVEDSEIVLPKVIVSEGVGTRSVDFIAGLIAWICILIGICIILFVIFMNRKSGELPINSRKNIKKSSHSHKYYKNRF